MYLARDSRLSRSACDVMYRQLPQRLAVRSRLDPAGVFRSNQALIDAVFAARRRPRHFRCGHPGAPGVAGAPPAPGGLLAETSFTGHVSTLLAAAARMRAQGHGTIVVLSSVAAIRPRKASFVYGAAKAGLDACARGLAGSPHGSGVRAPLATTPSAVGTAVAAALWRNASTAWVPSALVPLAATPRVLPRPFWRGRPGENGGITDAGAGGRG